MAKIKNAYAAQIVTDKGGMTAILETAGSAFEGMKPRAGEYIIVVCKETDAHLEALREIGVELE